ncbi:MAG: response regulator [Mucilaginibacter sp.]|nr:response regulator [Mucilaginibacter sp.]
MSGDQAIHNNFIISSKNKYTLKTVMRKKVYIADDDPAFIELMADFLDAMGYEAEGSNELLELLLLDAKNLPDVFLLNIRMWGEDSEIICRYLKSNEPTVGIPLILFSTLKQVEHNVCDRYADGFISIPFEINALPGLLQKVAP